MSEKAEPTKSLARLVKKEIITQKISSDCCRRAFLAAVSRGAGSFYINSDDYGVTVSAADHELIQKCVSFVRHFTSTEPVVKLHTYTNKLGPDELYEFDLKHSHGVLDKLVSLGILPRASELDAPSPQFIIEKSCCKIAYLMGAFVASGTLSVPKDDEHSRSSGYYMGFNCSSESGAKFLSELIGGFGTEPKFRKRGEVYSVYFKDAESISDMLTRMHAVTGMLEMLYPPSSLKSVKLDKECALLTDGRFSGGTSGLSIGHVSPEAANKGEIALVENGDMISIDIPARSINLEIPEETMKERRARMEQRGEKAYKPLHRDRYVSKALKAYALAVTSADKGAVRIIED